MNKILFTEDEHILSIDQKVNRTLGEYFQNLEKYIQFMEKFFEIDKFPAFSSYIIPWLKQEILIMTKSTEVLFVKITKIAELKSVMRFLNQTFTSLDKKGYSAKFIFELHFMSNIKLSLENILSECLSASKHSIPFELKKYEYEHESKKIIFKVPSEIGKSVNHVTQLISEFIIEFINNKHSFIGVIFLEEYFFDNLLSREFLGYLKNNIYVINFLNAM